MPEQKSGDTSSLKASVPDVLQSNKKKADVFRKTSALFAFAI
jgi:hypothetical protein